jgi:hypothetical protein
MEIDIAALQRLPEITAIDGLRPTRPRCLPGKRTQVMCVTKTCKKTNVVIHASPA